MQKSVVYNKSKAFYELLLENDYLEIDENFLKKLIAIHLGGNRSTIKQYMSCLIAFKFIKWSNENKKFIVVQNDK